MVFLDEIQDFFNQLSEGIRIGAGIVIIILLIGFVIWFISWIHSLKI
jgi:hypothetical protein